MHRWLHMDWWLVFLFSALLLHATDSLSLCLHLHVPGRLESPKHHMAIDSSILNVLRSGLQMDSCLCVKWFTVLDTTAHSFFPCNPETRKRVLLLALLVELSVVPIMT